MADNSSNPELDEATKNKLIGACVAGKSPAQAGKLFGINSSTAKYVWRKYKKTGTVENRQRTGRPRKLDERSERLLVRMALKNRRKPLIDLGNQMVPSVSESTVRRILESHNLYQRVARKKPFLTKAHKLRFTGRGSISSITGGESSGPMNAIFTLAMIGAVSMLHDVLEKSSTQIAWFRSLSSLRLGLWYGLV